MIKSVEKASRLKDFAVSAMFSVTELAVNVGFDYLRTIELGANATYALSVKVQNTDWMDFDATTAMNITRRTLDRPVSVIEEEEITDPIYLDLYETDYDAIYDGVLVLASEPNAKEESKFVYPQNLTLNSIEIPNLFTDSTLLNISFNTDVTPESKKRFQRLVTNRKIEKGVSYKVDVDLQCYDEFTIKMETTEGFHTKTIHCSNDPNSPSVSETFVPRMTSIVTNVKVTSDFNMLANDIAEPIQQEYITDDKVKSEYLKAFDLN